MHHDRKDAALFGILHPIAGMVLFGWVFSLGLLAGKENRGALKQGFYMCEAIGERRYGNELLRACRQTLSELG